MNRTATRGIIAAVGAVVILLAWDLMRRVSRLVRGAPTARAAALGVTGPTRPLRFYLLALERLGRMGLARKPSQTPREFADQVIAQDKRLSAFDAVTEWYYRIRFGNHRPDPHTRRELAASVRNLARSPKPRK